MKKFTQFFKQAVAKLGLQDKLKSASLSGEDQAAIVKVYEELAGSSFSDDYKVFKEDKAKADAAQEQAEAFRSLASIFGVTVDENTDVPAALATIQSAIETMNENIVNLANQAQPDTPQGMILNTERININGAHTKEYAFGIPHTLFSSSLRYNRIAIQGRIEGTASKADRDTFRQNFESFAESLSQRYSRLVADNGLGAVIKGEADYSLLDDAEIGTRYFVRRQDALIAQIVALPSLRQFFPVRSNIQDGDVLTNVLFSELSQAYQAGHISKGNYTFVPEKAVVHDVMFKHLINDMKWIEKNYLGYLNTSGSDPVKWSMIEWLVLKFAEQLTKEIVARQMLGYRVEPEEGKTASGMFAANGIVHTLINLYDKGYKVLPFFDEDLASYDKANIGDTLEGFVDAIAERVEDPEEYVIYLSNKAKPAYKAWYKEHYGTNTDYDGVVYRVPNHDNPIVFLPAMKNLQFIFASKEGNIQLLENEPGEQFKIAFQRDLEAVWTASYWKEGAGVNFSGVPKVSKAELIAADASEQVIFMNWPMTDIPADATTIDGKKDMFFRTAANTKPTVLTDITNAKSDVIYRIETGAAANATRINKTGKFSEISEAWAPAKAGEYIKLYYKDGKFHDVDRG